MTPCVPTSENRLQQLFTAAGRPLDELRLHQFLTYLRELQNWNRTMSLTSISDDVGIMRKHFLGSLDFLQTFVPHPGLPVLDVGTGAGFPGLPLKLRHPELAVDLVESSQRKKRISPASVSCSRARRRALPHHPGGDAGAGRGDA